MEKWERRMMRWDKRAGKFKEIEEKR